MSKYPPAGKTISHSWLTIKLLAEAEPAFTEAAIRNLVFNAAFPTNVKRANCRERARAAYTPHWLQGINQPRGVSFLD